MIDAISIQSMLKETAPRYDFRSQLQRGMKHEQVLDIFFGQLWDVCPASALEQRQGIDRWLIAKDGSKISLEYKADSKAAKTGNAFVETISVDTRSIAGWAYTSIADVLCYYVPPLNKVWLIDFLELRRFLPQWVAIFPTRKVQNSDYCTHGLLVPLQQLTNIAFEEFRID